MNIKEEPDKQYDPEPRWPAAIAALAVGGLYRSLPTALTFGPRWLFPGIVLGLLIPTVISHSVGKHRLNAVLGFSVTTVLTAGLILSLILLITLLLEHKPETPQSLLLSAASMWVTNILVFALWYWRLDAGGPHRRDTREGNPEGAIFFPKRTIIKEGLMEPNKKNCRPNLVDN